MATQAHQLHDDPVPLPGQSTPSTRTGPPRSVSYGFSLPNSPVSGPRTYRTNKSRSDDVPEDGSLPFSFSREDGFRTPLELPGGDRKGKKRESRIIDDSWNPLKWFQESPQEEKPGFFTAEDRNPELTQEPDTEGEEQGTPRVGLKRSSSAPHTPADKPKTAPKWGRLRSLLPHIASQAKPNTPGPSAVTPQTVNITDELIAGGLSTLMLRMWFERDEKDHRRIPALFHRLRIRVTDSLNPLDGQKSVFRIECEYANGAIRWVVYRQLRDFFSLHTHYALSNAYNRNVDNLPEFPKTSTSITIFRVVSLNAQVGVPYFKFLKKEDKDLGSKDFARMQRESLETYLISLIRAVVRYNSCSTASGIHESLVDVSPSRQSSRWVPRS
jgi:phospholipase D1/2